MIQQEEVRNWLITRKGDWPYISGRCNVTTRTFYKIVSVSGYKARQETLRRINRLIKVIQKESMS